MFIKSHVDVPMVYRKNEKFVEIKPNTVTLVDEAIFPAEELLACYGSRISIISSDLANTINKEKKAKDEVVAPPPIPAKPVEAPTPSETPVSDEEVTTPSETPVPDEEVTTPSDAPTTKEEAQDKPVEVEEDQDKPIEVEETQDKLIEVIQDKPVEAPKKAQAKRTPKKDK